MCLNSSHRQAGSWCCLNILDVLYHALYTAAVYCIHAVQNTVINVYNAGNIYCIQHTAYSITILYPAQYTVHVYSIRYSVLSTVSCTVYCILYCILYCIIHCILDLLALYTILYTIQHCIPHGVYCIICCASEAYFVRAKNQPKLTAFDATWT